MKQLTKKQIIELLEETKETEWELLQYARKDNNEKEIAMYRNSWLTLEILLSKINGEIEIE